MLHVVLSSTTIFWPGDIVELLEDLKQKDGKTIWLVGEARERVDETDKALDLYTGLLAYPRLEGFPKHASMVRLIPGDAGVIFQLQHLLNHAHGIRCTLSLVILVPHGKTLLSLVSPGHFEDMPITVS